MYKYSSRWFIFSILVSQLLACSSVPQAKQKIVETHVKIERLATGFKFTEGPALDAQGNLYFTDIGNKRIHLWNAQTHKISTLRENSGGADGLFVDKHDDLWIAELYDKRLTKLSKKGDYERVLDSFEGRPFTGVNDLWFDAYGGIYFSDSYGGSKNKGPISRVFYFSVDQELTLVADGFFKSNGLQGSSDGRWLYVADYILNKVYRYKILAPGKLGEKTLFANYRCDGMTLDNHGNVYLSTGNSGHGLVVMSPEGKELTKIRLPENPANVTIGGKQNDTLYVTAQTSVYTVDLKSFAKKILGDKLGGKALLGNDFNSPQKPAVRDYGGMARLVDLNVEPKRLAHDFRIAQGPATDQNGDVFFSDIYNQRIMKWTFDKQQIELVRQQSGGPDGLFVEKDGSLLVCELTGKRFARLKPSGEYEVVADSYNGQPLTGPNDVYVDQHGGIYFSDSYPGLKIRSPPEYAVYYVKPDSDKLERIVSDHYKTKGIHASADGKWMYIADFGDRKVYRYRLFKPGVLGEKELFIDTRCGGLTVDELGNVYISTVDDSNGVLVYSPEGQYIGKIMFPENTTNVTFAGPERKTLIVTTFKSLYAVDMNVRGMH